MQKFQAHRFSVAPMMDWTDRHCRAFHRNCTRRAMLYTEMVTTGAVLHGDRTRLIRFNEFEHPVALQLGGSDPDDLARATEIGDAAGYDEINLNIGCPSDRVQSGRFGACLMAEPELVARCTTAMRAATHKPVTVKCRIGIDDQDSEADLTHFIEQIAASGVSHVIIHARKAWLQGLSPKQNRDVPPLDYDRVYRLKQAFPALTVILNGGVTTLNEARAHVQHVDGVMLGREAYHNPGMLLDVDEVFFNDGSDVPTRVDVAEAMCDYIDEHVATGGRANQVLRHMIGLFYGQPGARVYRRHLSENMTRPDARSDVLREAIDKMMQTSAAHEDAA